MHRQIREMKKEKKKKNKSKEESCFSYILKTKQKKKWMKKNQQQHKGGEINTPNEHTLVGSLITTHSHNTYDILSQ